MSLVPAEDDKQAVELPGEARHAIWFRDAGIFLGVVAIYVAIAIGYSTSLRDRTATLWLLTSLIPIVLWIGYNTWMEVKCLRFRYAAYPQLLGKSRRLEELHQIMSSQKAMLGELLSKNENLDYSVRSLDILVKADETLLFEIARSVRSIRSGSDNLAAIEIILEGFLADCKRFFGDRIPINGASILIPNYSTGFLEFFATYGISRRVKERKTWLYFGDNSHYNRSSAGCAFRRGWAEIVTFAEDGTIDTPLGDTYSACHVEDSDQDAWRPASTGSRSLLYRSYVAAAVPMTKKGGDSLGVLCFDSMHHDAFSGPEFLILLEGLSVRVASILLNLEGPHAGRPEAGQ